MARSKTPSPDKALRDKDGARGTTGPLPRPRTVRGPARPSGAPKPKWPMPEMLGGRIVEERVGTLLATEGWPDYALIDMGEGEKLERYGARTLVRPEPQAMGPRRLPLPIWAAADAAFTGDVAEEGPGRWRMAPGIGESWDMSVFGFPFICRLTSFRHVGIFPEQIVHWTWMRERLAALAASGRRPRLLNLFGYTGIASLAAAAAGADVTHVDASKKAIAWGRENQAHAGLETLPIRWIVEDSLVFCEREIRRGRLYDGILLDPPRFGRGPAGEIWSLAEDLPYMVDRVRRLLAPGPSFLVLTAYAIRASFLALHELMADLIGHRPGLLESGELALREGGHDIPKRLLSTSMFARFEGRS